LIAKPGILFIDGLLDRLSDRDIADVLSRLESFTADTTIIISTGRVSIARWASQTLDLEADQWSLERYSD
jgi:putative ABC transport system ATP-binding protein